jgi:hypothetical protein
MAAQTDHRQDLQQDPRQDRRQDTIDELGSMGIAVGAVWAAVVAISVLAPDMVSGSEQQHMPVAAFGTWLWGIVATYAVLGSWAALRRSPHRRHLHRPLAIGVAGVWGVAAVVSIFGPVMETGSDPTRIPLAALLAPIAATVLTAVVRAGVDIVGRVLDDDGVGVVVGGADRSVSAPSPAA